MTAGFTPPPISGILTQASIISSHDRRGEAWSWALPASTANPLANLALYVPFSVSEPDTVVEGWVQCGATAGGNFDIGVYDAAGARLSSSGSTARTANDIVNTTALSDLTLLPGVRYYMAIAMDATSNYVASTNAAGINAGFGILESTSSFVLPSSPTLSVTTRAFLPLFGLRLHTVAF